MFQEKTLTTSRGMNTFPRSCRPCDQRLIFLKEKQNPVERLFNLGVIEQWLFITAKTISHLQPSFYPHKGVHFDGFTNHVLPAKLPYSLLPFEP